MSRVLFLLPEIAAASAVLLPALLLVNRLFFRDSGHSRKRFWLYAVFAVYSSAVCALVGFPSLKYIAFDPVLNLVPFRGITADFEGALLNIALFIPLGLLLPLFTGKGASAAKTALVGAGYSLFIELAQLFCHRATDVNDLLTNTGGTLIGYMLFRLLPGGVKNALPEGKKSHMLAIAALVFAQAFFLQPYLTECAWQLLHSV